MKTKILLLKAIMLFAILLIPLAFANQDLYGDVFIEINERGEVTISGITNNPELIGTFHDLTSKTGKYWIFNISSDEVYADLLFKVVFPEHTEITYIKSTAQIRIGSEGNAPIIRGIIKNKELEILVQYYFEDAEKKSYFIIILKILLALLIAIIAIYLLMVSKRKKTEEQNILKDLTERQKNIYSLLRKKDGVTQKYLEKKLNLPKSSISRNIDAMVRKNILNKINKGNSNMIYLNNKKYK